MFTLRILPRRDHQHLLRLEQGINSLRNLYMASMRWIEGAPEDDNRAFSIGDGGRIDVFSGLVVHGEPRIGADSAAPRSQWESVAFGERVFHRLHGCARSTPQRQQLRNQRW